MAIAKKELLIELIESLDSSEKRFFTRYANQTGDAADDKFYLLFRHLTGGGKLEEPDLPERLGIAGPSQLVNLQRHLYGRILDALRLQHRRRDPGVQVREQIDYANLLYDRGLYLHALKVLGRAKRQAYRYHLDLLHLSIIDFEKTIESRHITRSSADRMSELTGESRRRQEVMGSVVRRSNLQLMLQRYFIQHGHVGGPAEARIFYQRFRHYFSDPVPANATYHERVLDRQCRFWYHYIQLQLEAGSQQAAHWVELIDASSELRERDVNFYIKGSDRGLLLAFLRGRTEEHDTLRERLNAFMRRLPPTRQQGNSRIMAELVLLRAEINQLLLGHGTRLTPGPPSPADVAQIATLAKRTAHLDGIVDRHKQLVLYYKLAVLSYLSGLPEPALDYLAPILDERKPLRYDVIVYGRLLQLWCHHNLGHGEFVGYGINNLARYLGRIEYPSPYPALLLSLLRGLVRGEVKRAWKRFDEKLAPLRAGVFQLRELRYFDAERLEARP